MKWLVDLDEAAADGTITGDASRQLKLRAREAMVAYAINLALFVGIVMVIGGAVVWLDDRRALSGLGLVLTIFGMVALLRGNPVVRIVANATAIIGSTLAVGAAADLLFDSDLLPLASGAMLGLPVAGAGLFVRRSAPEALAVVGGWLLLIGAAVHVFGLLITESEIRLEWLALHYAGLVAVVCGLLLDVRFVTALGIVAFAAALSSRTFYVHARYSIAIYEVTLTILQMSSIALLCLLLSNRSPERIARHSRTLGQLALIWVNVALWIGSLWGDVVGFHLWGPTWERVTAGITDFHQKTQAWRLAVESFNDASLVISPDLFAAVWALGLLAVGAWGALTARRAVLNIVITFSAIHFYTQYFERLEGTPEIFVVAGIIAIVSAWGIWAFNKRLSKR
jgi:hypothetical protein